MAEGDGFFGAQCSIVEAAASTHGNGCERIAAPGCSDRTIRRRLAEWAHRASPRRYTPPLRAYDQIIGLE